MRTAEIIFHNGHIEGRVIDYRQYIDTSSMAHYVRVTIEHRSGALITVDRPKWCEAVALCISYPPPLLGCVPPILKGTR